jgi:hypothetical protein
LEVHPSTFFGTSYGVKTPTLIVRLVGLYLVTSSAIALVQIQKMESMPGMMGMPANVNPMLGSMQFFAGLGLLVGVGATWFAGPLARLLTFDSEPGKNSRDISDQLLGR